MSDSPSNNGHRTPVSPEPTVGRMLHFFPIGSTPATDQPYAAQIAYVNSPTSVNLGVLNRDGHLGFSQRNISLRVNVRASSPPAVTYRMVGKEALEEGIALEFRDLLDKKLGEGFVTNLGTFNP